MSNRRRAAKSNGPSQQKLNLEHLEDRTVPNATYHDLSGSNFSQDWSDAGLITTDDDWANVPSIVGYLGGGLSSSNTTDPQTVVAAATDVDVVSGSSASATAGGVHEITASATIALQGSTAADAPHIVIHLNTEARQNVTISYTLKELDASTANQLFALQYRVGESGDFTNVPAGAVGNVFNATGNQTQNVSVTLPSAVDNQARVQVRIITNDAAGSDAMVGIDDIVVTGDPPNSAPVGADNTVTLTEDGTHTFAASDFGFSDPNDTPAHNLLAVRIATLPSPGTLTNNGSAVSAGDFISAVDITAGLLQYTPATDEFGTPYTSFTFQVQDDGGTDASGVDLDQSANTFTITVTAVADTPSVTDATTNEDEQTTSGLVVTPNAADGTEVTHFQITSIQNGALFLSDGVTPIADGDFITVAQGGAGLKFTPAADFNGTGSFGVQASTGGTAAGLGGNTATATITVTAINDAPTFDLGTGPTVNEDAGPQTVTGFAANFQPGPATATDESGQTAVNYTVTATGTTGTLSFDEAPAIGANGTLTYFVSPDTNGTATFDVVVLDSGGATGETKTFTITVNAVNDEPTVTLVGNVVVGQDSGSFLQTNFATFAPGGGTDEAGQTATGYTVTNNNGALFSAPPAIDTDGTLSFTLAPGASGTATVTVTALDSGGATSDEVTFTITVQAPIYFDSPLPPVMTAASSQIAVVGSDTGVASQVRVLDAATGAAKFTLSPFVGFAGGVAVAVGDLTGDGIDDVIVATATGGGHVKAFDGTTGAEIRSFFAFPGYTGGVSLAAGDVDGDGITDIVVGTATQSTHVKVFSGANGGLIRSFFAYEGFGGGVNVAAGDINGDGRADIAVIAGPGGSGHIKAFSGTDLALLTSFIGYQGYAGVINLAVGDLTGDGLAEIISTAANPQFGTHVKAVNQQGNEVRSFFAPNTAGTGGASQRTDLVIAPTTPARVGAGNVSGSNLAEILLGTGSKAVVLNGTTGAMMSQLVSDPILGLGVFVDV